MSKINKDFGYLGYSFQLKLIFQIIQDKKFGENIIEVLDPVYFDNQYFRLIISLIREYFDKYEGTPSFDGLDQMIKSSVKDETLEFVLDILKEIKNQNNEDYKWVQDKTAKFCKQQEIKKAHTKIGQLLKAGDEDKFDHVEEILRKALEIGAEVDEGIDVFHQLDDVLSSDFRHPIPTGIRGIDNLMMGGLSKGELGLFIAPLGIGKSTFLTKIANSAYNAGNTVLQIVFEDNPKVIQRKHISCWTGIELNELPNHKDEIIEVMRQIKERPGRLIIHKFPSFGVTMGRIKALIKRLHSRGVKPDIVLLDYIECVLPENNKGEEWISEGRIMRQFESMANDFDFVAWVASQGNRSSISADIVTTDKMGGNIKKAQIGHFIVSAAKSLQQKELGLATVAVLKSRFGKDGVVFKNCTFDNSRMIIDTEESLTFLGFDEEHKNETQSKSLMRIREVLDNKFFKNNENDSGRN